MGTFYFLLLVSGYFILLMLISVFTTQKTDNQTFFTGNKQSPWYVVAFGMIGASLSGVTFISIPGWVASSKFAYMQTVLGYMAGYFVIATVLMPLYYRMNLTSIYTYLEDRFGYWTYKTGAMFFILSRTIGASFRMFLVAGVIQFTLLDKLGIPFWLTVIISITLIWLYTFRGGIKTIVWTDTLQTFIMLLSVVITIFVIAQNLKIPFYQIFQSIHESNYSKIFHFHSWQSSDYFWKHFLGGMFIAIAMTGLDQDMMQKNLSCKNIKEAQKNMFWFSLILVFVNFLFLSLGAMLYIYADTMQIVLPNKADMVFPFLAMGGYLSTLVSFLFILGLIAAAYSSADSALAALTTSFCVDILNIKKQEINTQKKTRLLVHIGMSFLMFLCIMLFKLLNNDSVIKELFTIAGYTYGPLLGLYAFGLIMRKKVKDSWVPFIALLSPIICFLLNKNSEIWFKGYQFGFELLLINGVLTFIGLLLIQKKSKINIT